MRPESADSGGAVSSAAAGKTSASVEFLLKCLYVFRRSHQKQKCKFYIYVARFCVCVVTVALFFHHLECIWLDGPAGAAVISSLLVSALPALPASCLNRNDVGTMGHLIDFFFTLQQQGKKQNPHNVFLSYRRDYFAPSRHSEGPSRLSVPSSFSAAWWPLNYPTGCCFFGNFGFPVLQVH